MRCFVCVSACALVASGLLLDRAGGLSAWADEPGEMLKAEGDKQQVHTEMLRREVEVQLSAARASMATDPRGAIEALKLLDEVIRSTPALLAEERAALRQQITAVLRQASRREVEQEATTQERFANAAAARERLHVLSTMESRQTRLDQLTDRFNALLDEGRYELAEAAATAAAAEQAAPDAAIATSLPVNARASRYIRDALATRIDRQKGVVETLHRAEVAHVPQSDEPPIVYVDAAEWQDLTLRRSKYSTDMYQEKPAEAKIRKALTDMTDVEFVETPLGDVVEYLKDRHNIEIQLDVKALDEIGAGSETPVTIQLKGISLRSALRLLLRQLDLVYTIQDEVLLITTPDVTAARMDPHVYKVADIVLPIESFNFSGGFGKLGGGDGNGPPGGQGQSQQQNGMPFNQQNNNPFQQQEQQPGNNSF